MIIVCNGMQRSGSTFVYNALRLYLDAVGHGTALGLRTIQAGKKLIQDTAAEELLLFKCHNFSPCLLQSPTIGRCVYTYRHPVDVAASHLRLPEHSHWELSEILQGLDRDWEDFQTCLSLPDRCLLLEYNLLYQRPVSMLLDALIFLGLDCGGAQGAIQEIVTSLDPAKVREFSKRIPPNRYDQETELRPQHVSDTLGKPGSKLFAHLTPKKVKIIQDRFSDWIQFAGWERYKED
jgi:hypothetical protein